MRGDSSRRLGSGAVGSGEVPACSLLVRKFFMQEMNVRNFLIKGQGEMCQGMGHGGARVGMGGEVPQPLLRRY